MTDLSGQGLATTTSPGETRIPAPAWAYALTAAGALAIIATYVTVILTQPPTLGPELGNATLVVMGGYLLGAVLIAAGTLPLIPRSVFALLPVAIALNIVIGQIVGTMTTVPLYLDSIGTVFIGILAGPAAGALAGVLTNVIWGVTLNPSVIAFTAGAAFIGAAAGWAARLGAFRALWTAVLAGAIAGVPGGVLGAPVAAFVFGGGLGVGTGGTVAVLQAAGLEMLQATMVQSFISDPADKALIFLLALLALRSLPRRIIGRYPLARRSLAPRPGAAGSSDASAAASEAAGAGEAADAPAQPVQPERSAAAARSGAAGSAPAE